LLITHALSAGESAILKTFGKDLFDLVETDTKFAAVFYKGLASRAKFDAAALLEADLSRITICECHTPPRGLPQFGGDGSLGAEGHG
jgi:hypothetical protein